MDANSRNQLRFLTQRLSLAAATAEHITRPTVYQIGSEVDYCSHAQILFTAEGYAVPSCELQSLSDSMAFTMELFFSPTFSLHHLKWTTLILQVPSQSIFEVKKTMWIFFPKRQKKKVSKKIKIKTLPWRPGEIGMCAGCGAARASMILWPEE